LNYIEKTSITHATGVRNLACLLAAFLIIVSGQLPASSLDPTPEIERFKLAWNAAKKGDRTSFNQIKDSLQGYVLFPYLQYEDYRDRRASVPVDEMADFLETHKDWAFTAGLRSAWLKSLAKKKRWADLVAYSEGVKDTVLRCQRARGQIITKQTNGVLAEAQNLWVAGKSQPDECDPVFTWLIKNQGVSEHLAWERIQLAMGRDNRSLTSYLARFIPEDQRGWLEDWQVLSRAGYSRLEKATNWPDNEITRMITATSLKRMARKDAPMAAKKFQILDRHFNWEEIQRDTLLREIALYSAVELADDTSINMARVPVSSRDSQIMEWWARFLLSRQDWAQLTSVIRQMPEDIRHDDRWRYWLAQAELRSTSEKSSSESLQELADKANYYGFLAADELGLAYNICPEQPDIEMADIERMAGNGGFQRALELRKAELNDWATGEWSLAVSRIPTADLKVAAALAEREAWHDRVIFALGNSGDRRFYEWRFPLAWEGDIKREAAANQLDPAWVYGTIRSESAMTEAARSSANALGLMQVTPATGKRVAKKHGLPWSGIAQLRTSTGNLPIRTAYMSDLFHDYRHNPVLVSGSDKRPQGEAAIWIETLPYFETRDYIPRVLAFTTIYDWRLNGTAKRVSARMPHIESGKIDVTGYTEVECRDQSG
jgi:soluble lytic murein transglycosylase